MIVKTLCGLAVFSLACMGVARAAPATPEEAQRLTTLFERYLGHPAAGEAGAIVVAPDGESYKATLSLARLLARLQAAGLTIPDPGPIAAELTPQMDGTWHVVVGGIPPISIGSNGQAATIKLKDYSFDGIFDPAIRDFRSSTSSSTGTSVHSTGPKGTSDVETTSQGQSVSSAQDAGDGTVNARTTQTIKGFSYALSAAGEGATPVKVDAHVGQFDTDFGARNERIGPLLDLWAFLVDHPSKETLVASQANLKAYLKALIPFASSLAGHVSASDVSVNTPMGPFGATSFSESYDFKGPTVVNGVATTLKMSGFTMPSGIVPPWAASLVPTSVDVTESYGPLDFTSAINMAIDDIDLAQPKSLTDQQNAAIVQSLTPTDSTVVTIAPSTVTTATMTLKLQGDIRMGKPLPSGHGTVSVTGLDKTIDQIRATSSGQPDAEQAIQFLSAVKIMAKADGLDSYAWVIDAPPGGDILVNGNPLNASAAAPPAKVTPAPVPAPAKPAPKKKKSNAFDP